MTPLVVRQKMFLAAGGIVLSFLFVEGALRFGGFVFLRLQEYRNTISLRHRGGYRIMCVGESTTALGGRDSYPSQLEEILNQRNPGMKFSVINKGIPASNVGAILSQAEENLNRFNPDMVVAMMGINDCYMQKKNGTVPIGNGFRIVSLFRWLVMRMSMKTHEIVRAASHEEKGASLSEGSRGDRPKDARGGAAEYSRAGWRYKENGDFLRAEEAFQKCIELEPRNDDAFLGLGFVFLELWDFKKMEESLKKAMELNPGNSRAYLLQALLLCSSPDRLEEAEALLKKATAIDPGNETAYFELGQLYVARGMAVLAENNFKKAVEVNPLNEKAYGALVSLSEECGKPSEAEQYRKKMKELRREYYNPAVNDAYQRLKDLVDKRGIRLVCVQYPVRSVEPLKEIFAGQTGVVFVDNEKTFKNALRRTPRSQYFSDMFAGDFGHCTREGNKLLAENVAGVILKEIDTH
jgi:tetratricopeptide (TPR) repeat protein